jgi:hypothetical protein
MFYEDMLTIVRGISVQETVRQLHGRSLVGPSALSTPLTPLLPPPPPPSPLPPPIVAY